MKNSTEMCLPLCLPFACEDVDSREVSLPEDPCTHYYAELYLPQEGQMAVRMEGREWVAGPGDAVFCCPGVSHTVRAATAEPLRFEQLRMDPDRLPGLPDYAPRLRMILAEAREAGMPMLIPAEQAKDLALPKLVSRCLREARERSFGYDLCILSRLSLICIGVIRFWMKNGLRLSNLGDQEDPIYTLSGYIQRHLRDGLRVEDLAAYCGLSYPWFAKKFREIYGVSCKDFIEQIRVAQVEQYLMYTVMGLTEISEMTGYADCSHMIKNFKRLRGITPGQFRLKQK